MAAKKHEPITNLGWFFLFALVIFVDILQIVLDLAYASGVIANRVIDVSFAFGLLLIFYLKDVPLTSAQYTSIAAAFVGEEVPFLDALPMWTMDVFYIFVSLKKEEISKKMGVVGKIGVMAIEATQKVRGGGLATAEAGVVSSIGKEMASSAVKEHLPTNTLDLRPSAKS
ncbi:MAG: hypothetical protein WCO79_00165 [bacterium]